jgi:hypothetical protein
MSNLIPIFFYPGGNKIQPPSNAKYVFVDTYGGGSAGGPLQYGALTPVGLPVSVGVAVEDPPGSGIVLITYHGAPKGTTVTLSQHIHEGKTTVYVGSTPAPSSNQWRGPPVHTPPSHWQGPAVAPTPSSQWRGPPVYTPPSQWQGPSVTQSSDEYRGQGDEYSGKGDEW